MPTCCLVRAAESYGYRRKALLPERFWPVEAVAFRDPGQAVPGLELKLQAQPEVLRTRHFPECLIEPVRSVLACALERAAVELEPHPLEDRGGAGKTRV